ncbi:hypothetical protein PHG31p239 [Aeromonas phage 31]|uniref:Uncharacterized protein PHG31ORF243c n=2 Tax=Biquartavirus TaxID=1912143 RepID=Q56EC2_9CAUD|nr:hypothetical protein PHG31p239 [Aeromonas phage 31]APU01132.1 hypothetical protein [Aeromonas phage 31.2]APU02043.1 hypothetical protein [Aeromonas phage L9-6]UYD59552.1 hypothetical protein JNMOADIG_00023 [Aeromonas phage avDM5]UYD60474.1 hypothetical protein NPHMPGLK_00139 [Aeromonas phage avDM2]AAX63728.1 hypothetical protein PHG31p239 [Aeromonas phage 31]
MFAIQHKKSGKCIRSIEYSSSGYIGISFVDCDNMQDCTKVHVFDTIADAKACMNGKIQVSHDFFEFEVSHYHPDDYQVVCLTATVI